jgi:hypothetical protein
LSEEKDTILPQNSSGLQHRSRSRSRTRETSDFKYTSNNAETKEFGKADSSERDYDETKDESPSTRETLCDEIKNENGVSP